MWYAQAVSQGKMKTVCVTNYKKDGTMFKNVLSLHPIHSAEGYAYSVGVRPFMLRSHDDCMRTHTDRMRTTS